MQCPLSYAGKKTKCTNKQLCIISFGHMQRTDIKYPVQVPKFRINSRHIASIKFPLNNKTNSLLKAHAKLEHFYTYIVIYAFCSNHIDINHTIIEK